MRARGGNASWPFAELLIEGQTARVQLRWSILRRLLGQWLPSVQVPLGGTVVYPASGRIFSSPGVQFELSDGCDRVTFWSREPLEVLEALQQAGATLGATRSV